MPLLRRSPPSLPAGPLNRLWRPSSRPRQRWISPRRVSPPYGTPAPQPRMPLPYPCHRRAGQSRQYPRPRGRHPAPPGTPEHRSSRPPLRKRASPGAASGPAPRSRRRRQPEARRALTRQPLPRRPLSLGLWMATACSPPPARISAQARSRLPGNWPSPDGSRSRLRSAETRYPPPRRLPARSPDPLGKARRKRSPPNRAAGMRAARRPRPISAR